ncbi:MAG: hypothetical protein Q4Q07_08740 [Tissierellia bacterium]|nr:hypothetical protein [Tissierellia bacterium]
MKSLKLCIIIFGMTLLLGCHNGHTKVELETMEGKAGNQKITIIPYKMDKELYSETIPSLPFDMDEENMVFALDNLVYGKSWNGEDHTLKKNSDLFSGGELKGEGKFVDLSLEKKMILGINEKKKGAIIYNKEKKMIPTNLSMGFITENGKSLFAIRNNMTVKGDIKDYNVEKLESLPLQGIMDPHTIRDKNLTSIKFIEQRGGQILVGGKTRDQVSMVYVYDQAGEPIMYLGGTWGHMTGCSSGAKVKDHYYISDTSSNIMLIYNNVGGEIGLVNFGEIYKDHNIFLRSLTSIEDRLFGAFVVKTEDDAYQVFIGEMIIE